ncbi:MAG: PASTA domain-containing protein [Oscillibacter sp.]|nr:PASTA domain-containing protein [Oscillibacter sp.]
MPENIVAFLRGLAARIGPALEGAVSDVFTFGDPYAERPSPRRSEESRRANQVIRTRILWVMFLLGIATFAALFFKLYDLQIRQHDSLQERAAHQQTRSAVITASRGSILDRNGDILAASATAETVIISPKEIQQFVRKQQEEQKDAAAAAEKKKQDYYPPRLLDQSYVARGLSRILNVDQNSVMKQMENTRNQYAIIKKKVDQKTADEVRRFMNGLIDEEGNELTEQNASGQTVLKSDHKSAPRRLQGIWLQPDSKRYYPNNTLAANVLGFVNGDNVGGVGLESKYESDLQGVSGMTITAKNAEGTDLLYQYEQYYDAEDGNTLVLTMDVTVQNYLEKGLRDMIDRYDAANGAAGIVMDVNTGGIVAMASYPDYDPNQYSAVIDPSLVKKTEAELQEIEAKRTEYESEEAYEEARAAVTNRAMNSQWRNKCVDSTYEPGSTFKPITLAAALEEGLIDINSTFNCTGSIRVPGWSKPIGCSKRSGHGVQDLKTATGNSCNPAFITMGLSIGTETYYRYLKSFGLMEKTGIDMIGEVQGIFASEQSFNSNVVSLASYAFGQTFNVTPVELIRAQAACINGGYLYTPYIVEKKLDSNGNIVWQHDATPIRQVVSEETSAVVRECLEYVVAQGTGKNGQVAGYRIGGKTGTADKTGSKTTENPRGDVVVSFMCFAPADSPRYIMLLTLDTPSRDTGVYVSGGNMVAPTASQIMADILPYLGVEPEYTEEELARVDVATPNVVGRTLDEAVERLNHASFSYRTVGNGDTVTDQTPAGGAIVPNNAQIILYLGQTKPDELCTVPDVLGMSIEKANQAMTKAGLILRVSGTTRGASNILAIRQEQQPGSHLTAGSVVTVQFGDGTVLD